MTVPARSFVATRQRVEIDGRERAHCPDCDRVLVRDDDHVLLIERAPRASETWAIPGGHPEYDEEPAVGAARELEGETGLHVDPAARSLHGVVQSTHRRPDQDVPSYLLQYVVDRSVTTGELDAAIDDDARFWGIRTALDDERVRDVDRERERFHPVPAEGPPRAAVTPRPLPKV